MDRRAGCGAHDEQRGGGTGAVPQADQTRQVVLSVTARAHLSSQPPEGAAETLSQSPRSAGSAWAREIRPGGRPTALGLTLMRAPVTRGRATRRQTTLRKLELPTASPLALFGSRWENTSS